MFLAPDKFIYMRRFMFRLVESAPMGKQDKPSVQWVEISAEQADQRIDNFLLRFLKGVPKSRVYRILRKGEVRVNRSRTKPDYRLKTGDEVRIPPVRVAERVSSSPGTGALEQLSRAALYEDKRLLVIDKPSGMAVHGGSGLSYGVIEAMRALRPEALYLELVHRLDRETSGCLMIAKRRSELRFLHNLLRHGGITKRYLLLVAGDWKIANGVIDAPLRKNQLHGGERIVRVDSHGKEARTRFRLLESWGEVSLVEAELETGRTHQIRVHAAHAGHPLAGDEKYGNEAFNRSLRSRGLRRLFLHAHYLAFHDPDNNRDIEVSAPLNEELRRVINNLENLSSNQQGS